MKYFCLILFNILYCINLFSQGGFNRKYTYGIGASTFHGVHFHNGKLMVVGTSYDSMPDYPVEDTFLSFFDSAGNIVSTKQYVDTVITHVYHKSISPFFNNGYFLSGSYYSKTHYINDGGFLFRLDSNYNVVWKKYYNSGDSLINYIFQNILVLEDSTLLICGYQLEFDSLRRNTIRNLTFIMKVGRDGEQIWKKEYYKSKSGGGGMIVKSNKNDEFIITETSRDFSITNAKNYYSQIWLYAIDTSGIVQWEYITPPQELMESNQVINTKDNGFLFSGVSLRLEVHNPWVFYRHFQGVIYKIDSNKNYVWSVKPDTSFTSFIVSATELSDGSIIAVGGWNSKPFDGWMLKISTLGEIIWQRRYSLLADEYGNHELTQAIAGPGGFIYAIGGVSGKDDNYYWRSWLLKLDSMGCVVPGCHTTGINDFKTPDSRILIYPNPASEVLNIFTPDLGTPHKYRIINSLGQTVKAWKGNAGEITYIIPLDDFKEGMYYLEVTAGNTLLSTEKFIVSK